MARGAQQIFRLETLSQHQSIIIIENFSWTVDDDCRRDVLRYIVPSSSIESFTFFWLCLISIC